MKRLTQALALLVALSGGSSAATAACSITVIINKDPLGEVERAMFARDLQRAADKVCGWWGETYSGPLTVDVSPAQGPSMSLLPAWRGERGHMLFRMSAVLIRHAATVHEVVHVFAPNANRFLAEGLAVYAHEHLHGPSAYPNFRATLHGLALGYVARADIVALDRIATPRRLQGGGLSNREAYIVAGSFVRFLIERDGMAKFRRLYAMTPLVPGAHNAGSPGRWREVYGASLAQLVTQWRQRIIGP
jgi:hypothetical protein